MTRRVRPLLLPASGASTGTLSIAQAVGVIRAAGVFDERFYLDNHLAADPMLKLVDPVSHYLVTGYDRGFRPSADFNSKAYLALHPQLAKSGMNPLLHLCFVKGSTRAPNLRSTEDNPAAIRRMKTRSPSFSELQRPWSADARPLLDIIIPVHYGFDETLQAIHAVLSSANRTTFEVVVINDKSPDPELVGALRQLARSGLITLLHNRQNLGFAGTVNRALRLHPRRDAILLNSDTKVHGNWVDRLLAHAGDGVATVTPFSNNASLCSFPRIFEANTLPSRVSLQAMDRLCARHNKGQAVEVPTGVGFCMYVSRAAVREIGMFDEKTFGKGYGEDNDFCFRALKQGFRNLHALDVFVYHAGAVSFGSQNPGGGNKPLARLIRKHRGFKAALRRFALDDPSLTARQLLDLALLTKGKRLVDIRHISNAGRIRPKGRDSLLLYLCPEAGGQSYRLESPEGLSVSPNLRGLDPARVAFLLKALFPPGGKKVIRLGGSRLSAKNPSPSPA